MSDSSDSVERIEKADGTVMVEVIDAYKEATMSGSTPPEEYHAEYVDLLANGWAKVVREDDGDTLTDYYPPEAIAGVYS